RRLIRRRFLRRRCLREDIGWTDRVGSRVRTGLHFGHTLGKLRNRSEPIVAAHRDPGGRAIACWQTAQQLARRTEDPFLPGAREVPPLPRVENRRRSRWIGSFCYERKGRYGQ